MAATGIERLAEQIADLEQSPRTCSSSFCSVNGSGQGAVG